jgi:hypothetical protein
MEELEVKVKQRPGASQLYVQLFHEYQVGSTCILLHDVVPMNSRVQEAKSSHHPLLSEDQLLEYFQAFIQCSPDLETLKSVGSSLVAASEYELAQRCYESALESAPSDTSILVALESGILRVWFL